MSQNTTWEIAQKQLSQAPQGSLWYIQGQLVVLQATIQQNVVGKERLRGQTVTQQTATIQAATGLSAIGLLQMQFALITSKVERLGDYLRYLIWLIG